MRKVLIGTGVAAACLTASANADVLGFAANSYATNVGGVDYAVIDVYAMFNTTSQWLVNVFSMNISLTNAASFYNDPGTFAWSPAIPGNAADSRTAIGSAAAVAGDPGWAGTYFTGIGFSTANAPPVGSGWFNDIPAVRQFAGAVTVNQNATGGTVGVWVGRFSLVGITDGPRFLNVAGGMTGVAENPAGGTIAQQITDARIFTYVPAPGALALLGLAGLAGRRRRA